MMTRLIFSIFYFILQSVGDQFEKGKLQLVVVGIKLNVSCLVREHSIHKVTAETTLGKRAKKKGDEK